MSAKHDDIELMQHHDGELELAGLDENKLAALSELHELVAGSLEAHAEAIPDAKFAAMWREVDKATKGRLATTDEEAPRGVFARIGAWLDRHRGHVVTGMVSAGAVAAIALVMRPGSSSDESTAGQDRTLEVLPAAMRTAPVVDSLDTPDGTGTVMNFEDEDGHTTVIWVTPADTVEGI